MIAPTHGKSIILCLAAVFILAGCVASAPPRWELNYQSAIDEKRIEDVHHIAGLVEEFYDKTGRYPLSARRPLPVEVFITRREVNVSVPTVPMEDLEKELEGALGRDIELPIDHQKYDAWGGPRLYQYAYDGRDYFVSALLFYQTEYAYPLAEYTYKYQVSSAADPDGGIVRFKDVKDENGGRKVDEGLQNRLLDALKEGDIQEADRLLGEGALLDPVCGPYKVCRALAYAININGDPEVVEFIMSKGADLDGGNSYGDTPLIFALMKKNYEVARLLAREGANVNKPNDFGISPFIGVCGTGHVDLAEMFIEYGAELNRCYPDRTSRDTLECNVYPLTAAAEEGHLDVARLLLSHGAEPGVRNSSGKSALDYAREKSNREMEALLNGYRR